MPEFLTLRLINKYSLLSNAQKRKKMFAFMRLEEMLDKLFKFVVLIGMFLCIWWNINAIKEGRVVYGVIDTAIEWVVYPIALYCEILAVKRGSSVGLVLFIVTNLVIFFHTPTYSLTNVWSILFVIVAARLEAFSKLPGYPKFSDDLDAKRVSDEQEYLARSKGEKTGKPKSAAAVQNDYYDMILNGKIEYDKADTGIKKGEMDTLEVPDDLGDNDA